MSSILYLRFILQLKDYYKVLELPPSADPDDIKKAYRRLAHRYHPDKNGDDKYALIHFAAVKEAYETLINPKKKDQYLQQRWYAQSTGRFTTQEIITPVTILKQLLELERYASTLDIHRMDKHRLYDHIMMILSEEATQTLVVFGEIHMNEKIISLTLRCCRFLPTTLARPILNKLENIKASDQGYLDSPPPENLSSIL